MIYYLNKCFVHRLYMYFLGQLSYVPIEKKIRLIGRTFFENSPKKHLKEPNSRKLSQIVCQVMQNLDCKHLRSGRFPQNPPKELESEPVK